MRAPPVAGGASKKEWRNKEYRAALQASETTMLQQGESINEQETEGGRGNSPFKKRRPLGRPRGGGLRRKGPAYHQKRHGEIKAGVPAKAGSAADRLRGGHGESPSGHALRRLDGPLVPYLVQARAADHHVSLLRRPHLSAHHSRPRQDPAEQADAERPAAILCGPEKERSVYECGDIRSGTLRPHGTRLPHHLPRGAAKSGGGGVDPGESFHRL